MLKLKKSNHVLLKYFLLLLIFNSVIVEILSLFFIHGFAFVPYYRLLVILLTFSYFLVHFYKQKLVFKKLNNEFIVVFLWAFFTIINFVYGLIIGNSKLYLVADTIYILFGLFLFVLALNIKNPFFSFSDLSLLSKKIILLFLVLVILDWSVSEIFFIILLSLLFICVNEKQYKISLLLLLAFLFQVSNSNRALLVCFLAIIAIGFLKKTTKYIGKIDRFLLAFFLVSFISFFYKEFFFYLQEITPRGSSIYYRIKQINSIITSGIDFTNPKHISIAQRIVEAKVVISLWLDNFWTFIFGSGLGAVIDGSLLIDKSVTGNALLGPKSIHNIHLLPIALIHKYGSLGLLIFSLLSIEVYNSFKKIIVNKDVTIFWDLLFVLIFVYSLPAASFLWTTPVFWIAFAMKSIKKP